MEIIETIRQKLLRYPEVKFENGDNSITLFPTSDDGFTVSLYVDENCNEPFEVYFNGWHEGFTDASEALECFAFGLSDECRLKEYSRDDNVYKWIVESNCDGSWEEYSTTALIFFPFWKSQTVRVLQNCLITNEDGNE